MRVALIVPGFSADADDWCIPALRDLVARLAHVDDVRVFSLRYPATSGRYRVFGAEVISFGGGTDRRFHAISLWKRAILAIASEHRRRPFDVIHAFWADEPGTIATLTGRFLHVPTIVSLAGGELVGFRDINYGGQLAPFQRVKTDVALRLADAVTVGSRYEQSLAKTLIPPSRVPPGIVPLGVDVERFTPSPVAKVDGQSIRRDCYRRDDKINEPTVLSVASLVGVKDHLTLIEALARARDLGQSFRLELVGDGPLRSKLTDLADRRRVSDRVRFRGSIPHDRLSDVYRAADLFVVSSRHEAQGIAAIEAASCGLVVVGTRVGVVPDLAPTGGAVQTRDPSALVAAILGALGGENDRHALGAAARSRVLRDFDLDRCTARFRELYQRLGDRAIVLHPRVG